MGAARMSSPRNRLRRVSTGWTVQQPPPAASRRWSVRRFVFAGATAVGGVFGLGGVLGLLVGVGAGAGLLLAARPEPPPTAAPDQVPVVVELLAGCLAAGLALPEALDAAAIAGDAVTRDACRAAAAALRRGAPAAEAWHAWYADPWLEPVARTTARTTQSGAAVAEDLRRVAARIRARRHSRLQQRVQLASVWSVIPLGLLFLPAFVLVAVVPVVIGLFGSAR
jgi:Flp pilus assembly protein TadB